MKKIIPVFCYFPPLRHLLRKPLNLKNCLLKTLLQRQKKKKDCFLDAYASWCGPCKMMERNVFTQKSVGDYFNANFVNARFDMEKGEGRDIAANTEYAPILLIFFLNGDGELVSQNFGYMEESMFLTMAQDVNSPNNKKGSLKERFAKGEKDPDFLINIMKLNSSSDFNFAKQASERYFENKKATEEFSKDDVGLLLFFLKSTEDKNYKVFTDRKAEIIKFLPEETYKEFDNQIKLGKIVEQSIDQQNKNQ
jgi:thioredoxin-related protein